RRADRADRAGPPPVLTCRMRRICAGLGGTFRLVLGPGLSPSTHLLVEFAQSLQSDGGSPSPRAGRESRGGTVLVRLCPWLLAAVALLLFPSHLVGGGQGKKYALLVGVRDYEDNNLPSLRHTENDVEQLGKLLTAGGYQVVLLTSSRGEKPDARPTAVNIRRHLRRLLGQLKRGDTVLVALAGHGLQATALVDGKEREESFFCPADARPRDSRDGKERGAIWVSCRHLLKHLRGGGLFVKLRLGDACRNAPKVGGNVAGDGLPTPPRSTAALFSCKSGERAFETDALRHGVFFHFVL